MKHLKILKPLINMTEHKSDIESGIELPKRYKLESSKTPSNSNSKEIMNSLLHPRKEIHTICNYIHTIRNCIGNCVHNDWIWRFSPCIIFSSACYYIISRIDVLEDKIEDLFNKNI